MVATKKRFRRTWEDAEELARKIYSLRGDNLIQSDIAKKLGIGRALVAHYLNERSRASCRAGLAV